MILAGIDVGKKGALVLIDSETSSVVSVHRVPLYEDKPVWHQWFSVWHEALKSADHVTIEKINSSPQMGVVSAFSFGEAKGFVKAIVASVPKHNIHLEITPQEWKYPLGLMGRHKDSSVEAATKIIHGLAGFIKYKKDHDIAEAALIARYPISKKGIKKSGLSLT